MTFSIRDLLWSTAAISLILAIVVTSQQHASRTAFLKERVLDAERHSKTCENEAKRKTDALQRLAVEKMEIQDELREEILALRQLLKQSLGDRREWFELEVQGNRIIAIGPATSESVQVTAEVVELAERTTGLDGGRLRHFLTPIRELELVAP